MIQVTVTGGEISEREKAAYVQHVLEGHKGVVVDAINIEVDGEYVNLRYALSPMPFNRIRRITGYLVGDVSRWNDAKRKELSQRTMSISSDPLAPEIPSRLGESALAELSAYARSLI